MEPRHNAFCVMQQVSDAANASEASQPEHKQIAQCCYGEQLGTLLDTKVYVVQLQLQLQLLCVSLRLSTMSEYSIPA
jgi:hypothetical protein